MQDDTSNRLLRGGTIVDGTGAPAFAAGRDTCLSNDGIARVDACAARRASLVPLSTRLPLRSVAQFTPSDEAKRSLVSSSLYIV